METRRVAITLVLLDPDAWQETMYSDLIIGFDGSVESRDAVALGGRLARAAGADVGVEPCVAEGDVATEVVRRSVGADLLVIGSRGYGPAAGHLRQLDGKDPGTPEAGTDG